MPPPKLQWNICKWRLAILWLSGGATVFILLLIMSMLDKFGTDLQDAWGWFLSSMMPSLSLIVGVLVSEAGVAKKSKAASSGHYRLALGLSAFYILIVLMTLLATSGPAVPDAHRGIAMLRLSNLWLGPLQGLASAALGIFYVRSQPAE